MIMVRYFGLPAWGIVTRLISANFILIWKVCRCFMVSEPKKEDGRGVSVVDAATGKSVPRQVWLRRKSQAHTGPAIGFWKKLCSRKPDTESAPPSRTARNDRLSTSFSLITSISFPATVYIARVASFSHASSSPCRYGETTLYTLAW